VNLVGDKRITVDSRTPIDARIRLVTDSQRWSVSRKQLLICGVSDGAILRRLRNGRLECVHPGVYAVPHASDVSFAAETAALLTCGEDAVLSHHSAVTLWELRPGIARPVHVTIPGDRGFPVAAGVKLHRSRTLAPSDIRFHRGLPVTSPARGLLDTAAGLPDRDVERLLDEALFARRLVTLAEIGDLLARCGRHPGRARLKRVASPHDRSTSTDSPPEETMLGLVRAGGLPEPRLQVDVLGYRLDFLWPALGLAVEVDAYGTHGSPARFEADRRRDARLLTEKGISVLRLTKHGIVQRPYEALAVVARAVGQREVAARRG
jgi:very-short-patch-repair endonuclease